MKAVHWFVLGALLAACSGEREGDTEDEDTARGGVIGEAYVESLEEAEAVEDLVLEQKDRIDAALEEANGGD